MKKTALKKQVICITHLPQVAALADYHYCIEKKSTDDETITSIHLLDSNQKIIEIAKMFCDIFNDKAGIEFHPEKEEWGTTVCMDTKKARDELGYKAIYNLRDIVLDIKEEYREYNG